MEADIARLASVLIEADDVDTITVWSSARTAGCRAGRGASRLMIASQDDKT